MAAQPSDRESPFGPHELLFSTTNRKGVIESCNDVFVRVAGHPEEDMIGRAHNLIRHPDMPRSVFRMVWDDLLAGRPVVGYVKNLAADGRYYWVMAIMLPHGDGFLSVRLRPTSSIFLLVRDLYATVRAHEREREQAGMKPRDVAVETVPYLLQLIADAGFPDYGTFARHALSVEIRAREAAVAASGDRRPPLVGRITRPLGTASVCLDQLFAGVDVLTNTAATIDTSADFIRRLATSVQRNALNGVVGARRLTAGGATLGVVADHMSRCSESIAAAVVAFTDCVSPAMASLRDAEYRLSLMKAQLDMATDFALELERTRHEGTIRVRREQSLAALIVTATGGIDALTTSLTDLGRHLRALERGAEQIASSLALLDALQIAGRIEAQHIGNADAFTALFDRVRQQLRAADIHMGAVDEAVRNAIETRADTATLRGAIADARDQTSARSDRASLLTV